MYPGGCPGCGLHIKIFAIDYGIYTCIFLMLPPSHPVTAAKREYASPVFRLILVSRLVSWFVDRRKPFAGPIKEVAAWDYD